MITADDFIPTCMKYMAFIVNVLYWMLGASVIAVGLYVQKYHILPIREFLTMQVSPAFITIIMGMLLFITAIIGFVGALRENLAFLKLYLGTLLFLLMIHAVLGASAFVYMSSNPSVSDQAEGKFHRALFTYKDDEEMADFMNKVQTSLQCCGIEDYKNWSQNPYFACEPENYSSERCSVPASCCKVDKMDVIDLTCGYGVTNVDFQSKHKLSSIINTKGCIPRIEDCIQNATVLLGFSAFAIAIALFFGVILANRIVKALEMEIFEYWKRLQSENHVMPYNGYYSSSTPETGDSQKTGHFPSSELEYNFPVSL